MRRWLITLLAVVGCSPTLPPPEVKAAPPAAQQTEQAQLLLFPEADGEALLGRAVQLTKDGGATIADARAPGCEVEVRREKAQFNSVRRLDLGSMTTLAGSYSKLVSLEAKFGNTTSADIDVSNQEILRADMRGPCGDVVIDTVFVGHGSRKITRAAALAASGTAQVGLVTAKPGVENSTKVLDAIDWKDDQAYGFSFRKMPQEEIVDVRVTLPSVVTEGDDVEISVESTRQAWLVVYLVDAEGKSEVLWPSAEEPAPHVTPLARLVLPTPKEKQQGFKLRAALSKPGQRTQETIVVYALADKRDFDALRPSGVGASELTKKLHALPLARWSRSITGYAIEPKR
jgi:hypothetical protein